MPLSIAVLSASESFRDVWSQIVLAAGADQVAVEDDVTALAPLGEHAAVVLSVGGVEDRAIERLADLLEDGAAPVVVVGSENDHRLASALIRAGAADYFSLPQDLAAVQSWLEETIERIQALGRAEVRGQREADAYDFSSLIGESPRLLKALERVARVIPRDRTTVLVTGETGTGKELIAQALHYNGPRRAGPFIEVNCTALPANLLEAELFGYEKGAFTDARAAKPGLFEAAHRGTLLLDEVGDLPLELQVKLLKVLEDKTIRRLGSLKSVVVDVRVVAATHVDLPAAVREGRFRQDLFYRLAVVPVHLPPLRERGDDLLLLTRHFLERAAEEYGMEPPEPSDSVLRAIQAHEWPGNVRELRNAVERALLLSDGELRTEDLFMEGTPEPTSHIPFPATLRAIERAAAHEALRRFDGNKSAAAEVLGISRTRLYRLLASDSDAQDV